MKPPISQSLVCFIATPPGKGLTEMDLAPRSPSYGASVEVACAPPVSAPRPLGASSTAIFEPTFHGGHAPEALGLSR